MRGPRVGRVFWGGKSGQMFEMIDNKLNDHVWRHRRFDGRAISKRMPGAPVLQGGFIGARGVVRGAFMEEGRDRFFGFIGKPLRVFQAGGRFGEQRREREQGRL